MPPAAVVRGLLASVGGLLLFASHPPVDAGAWLGPLALIPLLMLARQVTGAPVWVGAGWGLVAGACFFVPLLWWIGRFGTLPLLLLSAVQAVFVATFVVLLAAWGTRSWRPLVAVVWWVALEAIRSRWPLGGFPWGLLGYSQHLAGPFLPLARVFGILGVSAACAAVAAAVEEAAVRRWRQTSGGSGPVGVAAQLGCLGALAVAAVVVLPPPPAIGGSVDLAAVQGNDEELPPITERGATPRVERIVEMMLEATRPLAASPPDAAVWPENAVDADTREHPGLRQDVAEAVALIDGAPIIAGVILDGPRPGTFLNAIVLYGEGAQIEDVYIKRHLVPFGEYVPARRWLDWYPTLRHIPSDGLPGNEPGVFDVAGARIGPVTCFESVFPQLVHDQVRAGAQVLVVSTNNASFGRTPASRQHLAFSRLRAVETGRWVLHAGISGISAVVDPHGRSSQETGLFEQAIVRAEFPLVEETTPATRLGQLPDAVMMLLGVAALAWLLGERRLHRNRRPQ